MTASAVRRNVVAAVAAKVRYMSRRGCGRARSLAEGQVQWYTSIGKITVAEAAAVLREFPVDGDYYGTLHNATPAS